jgi:hypothetical protein
MRFTQILIEYAIVCLPEFQTSPNVMCATWKEFGREEQTLRTFRHDICTFEAGQVQHNCFTYYMHLSA